MTSGAESPSPLGTPIPSSPHAVSVSMPTWRDVVAYEEEDPEVHGALQAAYPRFKLHRWVEQLSRQASMDGTPVWLFASRAVAQRCADFVTSKAGSSESGDRVGGLTRAPDAGTHDARVERFSGLWAVHTASPQAKAFWQHTGLGISSRLAEATLAFRARDAAAASGPPGGWLDRTGSPAKRRLRASIASLAGVDADWVLLFPTGMAAFDAALRAAMHLHPGRPTAQLGFPYVDSLKLQRAMGHDVWFRAAGTNRDLAALEAELERKPAAAVFTEVPSNPLLQTVHLERLAAAARRCGALTVVDDSMGAFFNLDLLPHADLVVASLTKYFCGRGDVMAGTLVINPESPDASRLLEYLREEEDLLFPADAEVLAERAADFPQRMDQVNNTTWRLVERLRLRDDLETVFYPRGGHYEVLCRDRGGYGGVFSMLLAHEEAAARFYDRLAVAKGPSFGMHVTLACPYTLLAHFHELDWAESCGVARHLIRVSVGLESFETLWPTFEEALGG